jgi:hypothetical protein
MSTSSAAKMDRHPQHPNRALLYSTTSLVHHVSNLSSVLSIGIEMIVLNLISLSRIMEAYW